MKLVLVAALAAATVAIVPSANAVPATCYAEFVDVGGQAYAVFAEATLDVAYIYLESNGEEGPQRGGVALGGWADPCQASTNPDVFVF